MADIKSRVTLYDPKTPDVSYFAAGTKTNSLRVRVVAQDILDDDDNPTGEVSYDAHVWRDQSGWVLIFDDYDAPNAGKVAENAAAVLLSTTPAGNDSP